MRRSPQIGRMRLGGNGLAKVNREGTVDRGKSPSPRPASMKQDDVHEITWGGACAGGRGAAADEA